MMDYTHAAYGAAGGAAMAILFGSYSGEAYLVSAIAGAVGGIAVDIEVKDNLKNPKVTDAGRSRLAVLGAVVLGLILAFIFEKNMLNTVITHGTRIIAGLIILALVIIGGIFSPHRTFTHSLLFVIVSATGVYCVNPSAAPAYICGAILHLILDFLNYPFNDHGIWLFWPVRKGKGIALGICKSARKGNKIFYFIGIIIFLVLSALYMVLMGLSLKLIMPSLLMIYFGVALHFVRVKSEKEQRHIMHIRGEI